MNPIEWILAIISLVLIGRILYIALIKDDQA